MFKIHISELTTDHLLARSVFRDNGELLLASGYKITTPVLQKLHESEQEIFWVIEDGLEDLIPHEIVDEQLTRQSTQALSENMAALKINLKESVGSLEDMQKTMEDTAKFKNIMSPEKLIQSSVGIIESVLSNEGAMVNLAGIRNQSDFTFQHSIEVAIVAAMIGSKFAFTKQELQELCLGVLLMDTGYLVMPNELVNRKGRVSFQEFSLLKEHTTYGYKILKENPRIPLVSAHVAYQHHERQDGGGYPRRLKGNNDSPTRAKIRERKTIHRYAEIAAVADYYVSQLTPKNSADAKSPQEVIELLIRSAGTSLNSSIVDALVTIIPIYPVGSRIVVLDDQNKDYRGFTGVVISFSEDFPEAPGIVLLRDKHKNKLTPIKLDLRLRADITIQFQAIKAPK